MSVETLAQISEQEARFGEEVVGTIRRIHEIVRDQSESPEEAEATAVIDSDVAPRELKVKKPAFTTLEEGQVALENLANELHVSAEIRADRTLIEQKLEALILRMRIMQGEEVPYEEQLKIAMRIAPNRVPEKTLEGMKLAINSLLPAGMTYSREDTEAMDAFHDEFVVKDPEEIKEGFHAGMAAGRIGLREFIELPSGVVVPTVISDENLWAGYTGTDEDGNVIMFFNNNPDFMYLDGEPHTTGSHENAHAVHLGKLKDDIARRELSPAVGVTTIDTPEYLPMEVVGQLGGSSVVLGELTPAMRRQVAVDGLMLAVKHNVVYMANVEQKDDAEIIEYAANHIAHESMDYIAGMVAGRRDIRMRPVLSADYHARQMADTLARMDSRAQQTRIPKFLGALTRDQQIMLTTHSSKG